MKKASSKLNKNIIKEKEQILGPTQPASKENIEIISDEPDVNPIKPNASPDDDQDDSEEIISGYNIQKNVADLMANLKKDRSLNLNHNQPGLFNSYSQKTVEFTCNYFGKRLYKKGEKAGVPYADYVKLLKMKVIK